jgi:hypothetical protein
MSGHDAKVIRKQVLDYWLGVMSMLEAEKQACLQAGVALSREFVDKSRICADQIRRDTKIKPGDQDLTEDAGSSGSESDTEIRLHKLKLVS